MTGARGALVLLTAFAGACGGASTRPGAPLPSKGVAPPSVAPLASSSSSERILKAGPADVPLVRLGTRAFGENPTYLAATVDDRFVATSVGMAGAGVDIFDASSNCVGRLPVEVDRAVRTLDFSLDGKRLLVSLVGGSASPQVQVVSVPDAKVVRTITLSPQRGVGRFQLGPEARFLESGAILAWDGGSVVLFGADGSAPRPIMSAPHGASIGTSSSKKLVVVSTPESVSLHEPGAAKSLVAQRARKGSAGGRAPDPRAFAAADGAVLFQDDGRVVLRQRSGAERDLGEGAVLGLGASRALFQNGQTLRMVDRTSMKEVVFDGGNAWLAPSESAVFVHSGADTGNAVSRLRTADVMAGAAVSSSVPPSSISFSTDGKTLFALDRLGVLTWDVTKASVQRVAFPQPADRLGGLFRTRSDVFAIAGDVYRIGGGRLEPAGKTFAARPRSFVRRDGSTVVCLADARPDCGGHTVMAPGQRQLGEIAWQFPFPVGRDRGFLSASYSSDGMDFGIARIVSAPPGDEIPIETTLLRKVFLMWAVPSEDGGVILTREGTQRRQPFLRRVTSDVAGPACQLGTIEPSSHTSIALSPSAKLTAVPSFVAAPNGTALPTGSIAFVDVDRCVGRTVALPAPPIGLDFSPDGRTLAVGLADRTIVLVPVPSI